MLTVFKHTLSRSRGAIFGWGLTLALLGMMFVPFYDTIVENAAAFEELMAIYPPEIMAFFGGAADFTSPEGFLSLEYFSFMPLVIGVYAVLAGSGMLADDEEKGVLDLIAAQPISRSALFWGRLFSLWAIQLVILAFGWAGVMFATTYSSMVLDPVELLIPFASLGGLLFFFTGLSLLFSMLLPSKRSAGMLSGIFLVASFFLNGLAGLSDTLKEIAPFFPLYYYQSDNWVNGFEPGWLLSLLGFGLLFKLAAWWAFQRRDIRVGGEGGWKLKLPKFLNRKPVEA
ncbi:MAG: hypothetical protein DWG76_04810 [Chloroflexi bacterium]|nr:ABC transporter permease subunit [Chloroflexota bacterium]MQC26757.1 hypothetical protein [Chloroflexota bacterium]